MLISSECVIACRQHDVVEIFWGAFANLRKATISFVMFVCLTFHLPDRMEQLGFHMTDFHEILYLSIFRKSFEELKVSSKSDNINGNFTWTNLHLWSYLVHFFLEWEMFQTKVVEIIKTYILCSVAFFFFENLAVCEIIWKIMLEPDRPWMTIWCMRIACWVTKDTDTLVMCNTYFFSTATMIALTRLIVTFIRILPVFKKKFCVEDKLHILRPSLVQLYP